MILTDNLAWQMDVKNCQQILNAERCTINLIVLFLCYSNVILKGYCSFIVNFNEDIIQVTSIILVFMRVYWIFDDTIITQSQYSRTI